MVVVDELLRVMATTATRAIPNRDCVVTANSHTWKNAHPSIALFQGANRNDIRTGPKIARRVIRGSALCIA